MLTDINVKGIVYSVIATVTLFVLLALLRLIFKRLKARVEAALAHSDWALKIQRIDLLSAERYKRGLIWTIQLSHVLSVLFLIYLYIPVVLMLFPLTEPLAQPFFSGEGKTSYSPSPKTGNGAISSGALHPKRYETQHLRRDLSRRT